MAANSNVVLSLTGIVIDTGVLKFELTKSGGLVVSDVTGTTLFYVSPAGVVVVSTNLAIAQDLTIDGPNGLNITDGGAGVVVAGNKIIGNQQDSIPDATTLTTTATLNLVLTALRNHGLIAP